MNIKKYTDIHIHYHSGGKKIPAKYILNVMDKAKLEKIAIISWYGKNLKEQDENINEVAKIILECPDRLYGLAWIEPKHNTSVDSLEKIICKQKYRGFKMIPNNWYPCDKKILPYYRKMAKLNVPCLLHSGILYFDTYSSKYCRPAYYEDLIKIEKFKFALAHISWPWTDECIALFGQWKHAKSQGTVTSEMFIDITPGTPPLYREDALKKLLSFGAEDNILFGTDTAITSRWIDKMSEINLYGRIEKDVKLYKKIAMPDSTIQKITNSNFEKFFS